MKYEILRLINCRSKEVKKIKEEGVILVDENDVVIGEMEKMEAHYKGKLHRAFSIFIFNSKNELLLQRRALDKYHSGGLWTNSCCSHPRANEDLLEAAERRLVEEIGIKTELKEVFSFIYCADLDNNLIEYEYDHVFFGIYDEKPILNYDEAMDYKWISLEDLVKDIEINSDKYTYWLKYSIEKVISYKNLYN